MLEENNEHKITSKIGAYGNVIVDDKTLINTELSYMEDNKSLISQNKSTIRIDKQTSNISKINRNPIPKGAYSSLNNGNLIGKSQGRNPEYYYEDEIILEENEPEKQNEKLIINEVKNDFIEKAKKIKNDFLTVSNNAKKNNDYIHEKYNIPRNVNDEFLNSSNLIKLMTNSKSGKMPPKLFSGLNNSNVNVSNNKSLMIQESNIIDEFTNKSRLETSKLNKNNNDGLEDYFNIAPDNSMMNLSAFTNNIVVKEKSQIWGKSDPNENNKNNIYIASDISKINHMPEINYNTNLKKVNDVSANYEIKRNNDFDIIHDSMIKEFDDTIMQSTLLNYNNHPKQIEIPVPDEKDQSFLLEHESFEPLNEIDELIKEKTEEIVEQEVEVEEEEAQIEFVQAERPPSPELNTIEVQQVEKVEELEKQEDSFFEETFFEESKEKYTQFEPQITDEGAKLPVSGPSTSFKKDKNSLSELYGKHVLFTWAEILQGKKAKVKQGIKEDRFFTNAFLEEQQAIDFKHKLAKRDFIKGLDSYRTSIKHIFESCEGKDFFEINDLFKVQDTPACEFKQIDGKNVPVEPKYNWGNNPDYLEEKKILFEKLTRRLKKTVFNKVSFLYDTQVLKQKYTLSNEDLDLENIKEAKFKDGFFIAQEEIEKAPLKIDDVVDKENYILKSNGISNFDIKDNDHKICLFRESLCDGNSFYRMFILAYFEHLITNKQLDLMAKIFTHIYKVFQNLYLVNESKRLNTEKFIFYGINLKIVLMIFNFIINLMRLGDYATAYKIMLKAFNLEDESFDKIVVGYLRLNVLDYLKFIMRNESGLQKNGSNERITKKTFFTNFTFSNIEPEEVILDLTAKIYNVNINLIYIDGSINNEAQKKLAVGKKTYFGNEENKTLPEINLFYNLNCYFKYYTQKEHKENLKVFKGFVSRVKDITFDDSEFQCNRCNKREGNKKIYFKSQMICACLECIRTKADSIINSRFYNYQKDEFLSREYYCKPLKIQKQLTIDDSLYIKLFGKNIWNELMQRINNNCCKCNKKSEKLYATRTNLNFCEECLLGLINDFTEKIVVLNDFEKRKMIKKHPELPSIFDLEESINMLQLRTEEKTAAAEQRLKNTYQTVCCECVENKKTSAKQSNESSFIKFHKIDIYNKQTKELEISSNSTTQPVHIICDECFQKHKTEWNSKKTKEDNLNGNDVQNPKANASANNSNKGSSNNKNLNNKNDNLIEFDFRCEICDKQHITIIRDEINRNNKNACCAGCSLF